ncbi:ornithine cyclodeaminase family protein [Pseudomonas vanderleydeniana]|uniref:Ornithine cyclodeaminase family protein n=1 Tax=Pseudomonas vanderleydeniana TaxID=2745495 RepID=A0A9E6PGY6_9PSED|nr:ornithine cyclodeaminase family protein [Pseudomonas vanderleydeniana]QXI26376.1 ornithine cyclodeaminase family protein [Pseudomonas vanderleydeniana]
MRNTSISPLILDDERVRTLSQHLDVRQAMHNLFRALATGRAIQPEQQQVGLANNADFINYLGALNDEYVYGVKTSPYIPTADRPIVTAWTLLMSLRTGQPLLLTDATYLTALRTAATTAVAVEHLAPASAKHLVIIGSGRLAVEHLRATLDLRAWERISIHSPNLGSMPPEHRQAICNLSATVELHEDKSAALKEADVVMLCTSSANPVLKLEQLDRPALITSISTNAYRAHEIAPLVLSEMDVYCDYRQTTPAIAGEMVLAAQQYAWSTSAIVGDLPELEAGTAPLPDYHRPAFFRSMGLGLEDVAIALALYRAALSSPPEST